MDNNTNVMQPKRPLALDGVRSQPREPRAVRPFVPAQKPRIYAKPRAAAPKEHAIWQKVQLPMLLLAGAVGGFFADNLALGLGLIGLYAAVAVVSRIASRTTFTLAFLLLGSISLMLLAKPSAQLIRNFASYAFALLLVGVLTLAWEARLPKRMRRKYRR